MRVLLDTNVLATGMVEYQAGIIRSQVLIRRRWRAKEFDLLISSHLLDELDRTLGTAWFQNRATPQEIVDFQADLRNNAIFVEITHDVRGVTGHWQDDLVLAAAVSGNADYLVTRDKEFRQVGEYEGVKLRTPAEFLIELDAALESE